jgi:putative membrane-bound dehydrogenase-like protein
MALRIVPLLFAILTTASGAAVETPHPEDAPKPLSPSESLSKVRLPPGFHLQLVAAEPLINEPSGVCWDERGRLFVCELHGYNLEGQYDIEALNRAGVQDHVVRRIQANDDAKAAAIPGTYGTVKMLTDTDGDGVMDKAEVWADKIPPCYGLCPAREGVIAACAPDIIYLADHDGDGKPEVRETLFTGFATGALERGINCPQWGPDDWIYVGKGHDGGHITGPHLANSVDLPNTDFRIKPDGSAIEPITGSTKTIGMAFTAEGERFVISTSGPGIHVAPIAWKYLARNPFIATPNFETNATNDSRAFPISRPHPWRTRRANDPGFGQYYANRYGQMEATPSGFFTSSCSCMVYQDEALPGLHNQVLACEPAQNLVTRAAVERQGSLLKLRRVPGEEQAEFLASADAWFHPMSLATGPDGSVYVVDFYREIIEDYSAIPRYLQQEYGLVNGQDRGRVWRLFHDAMPKVPTPDMSRLSAHELAAEIGSKYVWRRQTARRLLVEQHAKGVHEALRHLLESNPDSAIVISALSTLDALAILEPDDVKIGLNHDDPGVRVKACTLSERFVDTDDRVWRALLTCPHAEPHVRLQLALSLGESRRAESLAALARLAREHGNERWLFTSILSGLSGRAGDMLQELVKESSDLAKARPMLELLSKAVAARHDAIEFSAALVNVAALPDSKLQAECLRGLISGFGTPRAVDATADARAALKRLTNSTDNEVKSHALRLLAATKLETPLEHDARLVRAEQMLAAPGSDPEARMLAVLDLAAENTQHSVDVLIGNVGSSSPQVRDVILTQLLNYEENMTRVLEAIEDGRLTTMAFSPIERRLLLDAKDAEVRTRAARLLEASRGPSPELLDVYIRALSGKRDPTAGKAIFQEKCATCHQAHGLGFAVGPNLTAEFSRAEETIIRDILAPNDAVASGYWTCEVMTIDGRVFTGLLASESATSVTLRGPDGKEQIILRNDIEGFRSLPVSLMPDNLAKVVSPNDVANVIAWLRQPSEQAVLLDDNLDLVSLLNEGAGEAEFESTDVHVGRVSLRISPPQRYSAKIPGWQFPIREKPGVGEYRYLRFAWKTESGDGAMLELAADGRWPPAGTPLRRYFAGRNDTGWSAVRLAVEGPRNWTVQTRDLWHDFGEFTLTGIAPTAIGGTVLFDRIELLQCLNTADRTQELK